MSLYRLYNSIDSAEDAQASLNYVFIALGDSVFTSEKRVNECFFTRGRGRSVDTSDLFSKIQSTEDIDEEDYSVEEELSKTLVKSINTFLEIKIKSIEEEYEEDSRLSKNLRGKILDLKSVYAYTLSQMYSPDDLSDFISPDIDAEPWKLEWTLDHLEVSPLNNYPKEEVYSVDKSETKLLKAIKDKVSYDRFKILDTLVDHFKSVSRNDVADYILVNGFKFISESSSDIMNTHKLSKEDYHVINAARVTYISRRKIDLNYALELVNLPATTYKKRSNRIKSELIELGESIGNGVNNPMTDYLIS